MTTPAPEWLSREEILTIKARGYLIGVESVAKDAASLSALCNQAEAALDARKALEWALKYGDFEEELDGNPLMKMSYDKAQALVKGGRQ